MPNSIFILPLPVSYLLFRKENQWPWVLVGPHPRMVEGDPEMGIFSQLRRCLKK